MVYRKVDNTEFRDIAKLAVCLTNEIIRRTGTAHFNVDNSLAEKLCENYLSNGIYNVIAAVDDDKIVGFSALCESHSIYAEGAFGIIQEFYVMPECRSKEVGKGLVNEVIAFAKNRKWKRLELCTPPLPEFDRTVDFYLANGFEVAGGYKMKYTVTR